MAKNILYIKAQWLGDIIGGLPVLTQQKELWNKVYQTFYDMRHLHRDLGKQDKEVQEKYKKLPMYGGRHHILEGLKNDGLIEKILTIPYGNWNIFKFLIKNFRRYDEAIIPIKTRPAQILWLLLAKKARFIFENVNDISKYRNLADGECGTASQPLQYYKKSINFPNEIRQIPEHYITIFPSIFERSLDIKEWLAIIKFAQNQGLKVVIVWWMREKWFIDELEKNWITQNSDFINMLDKTSLTQLSYLLEHSTYCISGNGGPMWIANLLNPHCINIHTVSAFLMEPKVDNKSSFNLRGYHYPECVPCEAADSTLGKKRITSCVFYNTIREWECRKFNTAEQVILILQKNINKS